MNNFITIDERKIGHSYAPYVIAEMSANHNGDIKNAYKIIDIAKASGADAVKMQTYTASTLTIDSDLPDFQLTEGLWAGRSLYQLYQDAYTPWEWHKPLFDYASKLDITIFSSPFDTTAVDLLEDLNAPAYKIASFEAVDLSLIKYVSGTDKPVIISTGMANAEEIEEAIEAARDGGCRELAILHCVSGYPAAAEEYNLKTIIDMQKKFSVPVGLSDHTLENITSIASVALGGCIIEKHVTLDRQGSGPDDSFSLEPKELRELCLGAKTAWLALGKVDYGRKSSEAGNVKFRRSLYFVKDMRENKIITPDCVKSIRPGYGLSPKYLDIVVGKKTKCEVRRGTPASWEIIQ